MSNQTNVQQVFNKCSTNAEHPLFVCMSSPPQVNKGIEVSAKGYLSYALEDCGLVELRYDVNGFWRSRFFEDIEQLQRAVEYRGRDNLYSSLNRPREGRTSRAALANGDISRICRLPIDFDPVRPSGLNSTDLEFAAMPYPGETR
jgi:hypothetical protein